MQGFFRIIHSIFDFDVSQVLNICIIFGFPNFGHQEKVSSKNIFTLKLIICDALRDLVPSVQFKKRGKHPWRSVNFSKVTGF